MCELVGPILWFLMTSPCHTSGDSVQFHWPAAKLHNYPLVTGVTVTDSRLVAMSFISARSSLHPDSLVMTFESGIAVWEHDLKTIFRCFLLWLRWVQQQNEVWESGVDKKHAIGLGLKKYKSQHERGKKNPLTSITCSILLVVGIPAYIYILKEAVSSLIYSVLLHRFTAQITFLWLQMRYGGPRQKTIITSCWWRQGECRRNEKQVCNRGKKDLL